MRLLAARNRGGDRKRALDESMTRALKYLYSPDVAKET